MVYIKGHPTRKDSMMFCIYEDKEPLDQSQTIVLEIDDFKGGAVAADMRHVQEQDKNRITVVCLTDGANNFPVRLN